MNESKNYTKDDAYQLLSSIHNWTTSADTKTSILMAFISLLLGFTLNVFEGIDYIKGVEKINFICILIIALLILYVFLAVLAILFSSMALIARLNIKSYCKKQNIPENSLFYFKAISKMGYQKYLQETLHQSEEEIIGDLKTQIVVNSYIAEKKYTYFNYSLYFSIALFICAIVLLLTIHIA